MTNRDKFGMAVELMQGTEVDLGIPVCLHQHTCSSSRLLHIICLMNNELLYLKKVKMIIRKHVHIVYCYLITVNLYILYIDLFNLLIF
jgi:hypothetical protein